ncbi:glycosyltransferase family 4 protein [Isobaculum melis]|uniref:Glycosyltransferase involved in cell wall bisynthesis n=1 Tax=Isobaculum melis TaxID=142588 RepID=A0A1H9SNA4_9LACT|nr:glycosyltransferase family 4 protein [Isobaculum melis]SER85853.1 Glycosyltransferase involved in cell wall bisynthesis [Isobaculum melis]
MKVLHIGEYVSGGTNTYINELIKIQSNSEAINHIVILLSHFKSDTIYSNNNKIEIQYYKYQRKITYIIKNIFLFNHWINKIKPDIIHVHGTFAGLMIRIGYFFRRKKHPIVYCSHGWSFLMDTGYLKKRVYILIEKILSIRTDYMINISEYEDLMAKEKGLNATKMITISNGIAEEENKLGASIEINPFDTKKKNLLFVGRFDKQKGLDLLIDFFSTYEDNSVHLYIIGENVLDKYEVKVPKNVTLIGKVVHESIDYYYEKIDAVIIPSRWEGFGLVAIEAMKNAKPIIVSNRGALPDFVNKQYGYVFDLDNLNSLRAILENLSKDELFDMGLIGKSIFKEKYTIKKMAKDIETLYFQMLKKEESK